MRYPYLPDDLYRRYSVIAKVRNWVTGMDSHTPSMPMNVENRKPTDMNTDITGIRMLMAASASVST